MGSCFRQAGRHATANVPSKPYSRDQAARQQSGLLPPVISGHLTVLLWETSLTSVRMTGDGLSVPSGTGGGTGSAYWANLSISAMPFSSDWKPLATYSLGITNPPGQNTSTARVFASLRLLSMSQVLPYRYVSGSGSLSRTLRVVTYRGRPALQGVARFLSTTITTAYYEQAPRQHDEKWKQVEMIKQGSGGGNAQSIKPMQSRTPRHSLSVARPDLVQEAHHLNETDTSISTGAPSISLRTRGPHGNDGIESGESGPQSRPRSTNKDEDTFRPPRRMNHLPPLGTLPRTLNFRTQDYIEDAPLYGTAGDLAGQNKDSHKGGVARGVVAKAGSVTAIEHLPIHPDLLKTVLEKPELYNATPVETEAFHCLSSGKDVFIRQRADCSPAYLLPIVQKVISSQERRPGSTFVQTAEFARHIAKIRSISVLILTPWSLDKLQSFYAAKKLLSKFPSVRVRTALFRKSLAAIQFDILQGCDVLVANPRMLIQAMDELDQRVEIRRKLGRLQTIIVEDADVFVTLRSMPELHYIINELSGNGNGDKRSRTQGVVVSATALDGPIKELADVLLSPRYECLEALRKTRANHPRVKTQARR